MHNYHPDRAVPSSANSVHQTAWISLLRFSENESEQMYMYMVSKGL